MHGGQRSAVGRVRAKKHARTYLFVIACCILSVFILPLSILSIVYRFFTKNKKVQGVPRPVRALLLLLPPRLLGRGVLHLTRIIATLPRRQEALYDT